MNVLDFLNVKSDDEREIIFCHCDLDEELNRVINIENVISTQLSGLTEIYKNITEYNDIDFGALQFKLEYWCTSKLLELDFPNWSKEKYEKDIIESKVDDFKHWDEFLPYSDRKERIDYFRTNGTWYIPIIIIKLSDFKDCGLKEYYQLFEGHTRLSRLKIINKYNNCFLQDRHLVFVIEKQ